MAILYDKKTGQGVSFSADNFDNALSSGKYSYLPEQKVNVISPEGVAGEMDVGSYLKNKDLGFKLETQKEGTVREANEKYGGTLGAAEAALAGAARGVSFGLSDVAMGRMIKEDSPLGKVLPGREELKQMQVAQPIASLGGEVGGVIGSLLIPGAGEANVAKLGAKASRLAKGLKIAGKVGRGIGFAPRALAKASFAAEKKIALELAAKAGRKVPSLADNFYGRVIAQTAEGTLQGAGQAVSKWAIDDSSPEELAAYVGMSALLSGGVGAIGAGTSAGIGKIRNVIRDKASSIAEKGINNFWKQKADYYGMTVDEFKDLFSKEGRKVMQLSQKGFSKDKAVSLRKAVEDVASLENKGKELFPDQWVAGDTSFRGVTDPRAGVEQLLESNAAGKEIRDSLPLLKSAGVKNDVIDSLSDSTINPIVGIKKAYKELQYLKSLDLDGKIASFDPELTVKGMNLDRLKELKAQKNSLDALFQKDILGNYGDFQRGNKYLAKGNYRGDTFKREFSPKNVEYKPSKQEIIDANDAALLSAKMDNVPTSLERDVQYAFLDDLANVRAAALGGGDLLFSPNVVNSPIGRNSIEFQKKAQDILDSISSIKNKTDNKEIFHDLINLRRKLVDEKIAASPVYARELQEGVDNANFFVKNKEKIQEWANTYDPKLDKTIVDKLVDISEDYVKKSSDAAKLTADAVKEKAASIMGAGDEVLNSLTARELKSIISFTAGGAALGGLYGAVSDNSSVLGGAATGLALGLGGSLAGNTYLRNRDIIRTGLNKLDISVLKNLSKKVVSSGMNMVDVAGEKVGSRKYLIDNIVDGWGKLGVADKLKYLDIKDTEPLKNIAKYYAKEALTGAVVGGAIGAFSDRDTALGGALAGASISALLKHTAKHLVGEFPILGKKIIQQLGKHADDIKSVPTGEKQIYAEYLDGIEQRIEKMLNKRYFGKAAEGLDDFSLPQRFRKVGGDLTEDAEKYVKKSVTRADYASDPDKVVRSTFDAEKIFPDSKLNEEKYNLLVKQADRYETILNSLSGRNLNREQRAFYSTMKDKVSSYRKTLGMTKEDIARRARFNEMLAYEKAANPLFDIKGLALKGGLGGGAVALRLAGNALPGEAAGAAALAAAKGIDGYLAQHFAGSALEGGLRGTGKEGISELGSDLMHMLFKDPKALVKLAASGYLGGPVGAMLSYGQQAIKQNPLQAVQAVSRFEDMLPKGYLRNKISSKIDDIINSRMILPVEEKALQRAAVMENTTLAGRALKQIGVGAGIGAGLGLAGSVVMGGGVGEKMNAALSGAVLGAGVTVARRVIQGGVRKGGIGNKILEVADMATRKGIYTTRADKTPTFLRKVTVPVTQRPLDTVKELFAKGNPVEQLEEIQKFPNEKLAHLPDEHKAWVLKVTKHLLDELPKGKYVSNTELVKWASRWQAADNPTIIVDDLLSGTISPEQVDTVKFLYPDTFEIIKDRVMNKLDSLDKKGIGLAYQQKLQIMDLLDIPSLDPAATMTIQKSMQEVEKENRKKIVIKGTSPNSLDATSSQMNMRAN